MEGRREGGGKRTGGTDIPDGSEGREGLRNEAMVLGRYQTPALQIEKNVSARLDYLQTRSRRTLKVA